MLDDTARDVLAFWLQECAPSDWYNHDDALDQTIRDRFGAAWEAARAGGLQIWTSCPDGALAYCILTDQFPRNMFRGEARAFETDAMAVRAAKASVTRKFDLRVPEPGRQFFYLPLEHSESLSDQSLAVSLIATRSAMADNLLHARVHREIIRRFGRFPFRNAALGRRTSAREQAFLDGGAYGAVLREFQASDAA